jgi:Fe-S cluster assembly protein SufD
MLDALTVEKDGYVAALGREERGLTQVQPGWLTALRKAAIAHFAQLGFPTVAQEDWRFTNVAPIASGRFEPLRDQRGSVAAADVARTGFGAAAAAEIVIVDGRLAPELSSGLDRPVPGLRAGGLAQALALEPEALEPHLARHADYAKRPFAALNTAFFTDGAFVRIGDDAVLEKPVHILHVTTRRETPAAVFPRSLVVAGRNSQAVVVESHAGFGGGSYFASAVTEVVAADGAIVTHVKIEEESPNAFHIASMHSHQGRASTVALQNISLGAALTRNDVVAVLAAEGGEARLDGLYLAGGVRLVDNHTTIDHAMPHCASRELYKGILDDTARAVFNGRIVVRPDAQKTDSKQTNRNLLLSDDAVINTNPQLEIFADDVRCTHGATIGQLDEEALFYVRSRGVSRAMAERLLIYAFASEILDRIPFETARVRLERGLFARLARGQMNGDPTE